MGHLCPISIYGSPVTLLNFQMAPTLTLLMSSGSKKKNARYACLSEAKSSHSQRIWTEVPSSAPVVYPGIFFGGGVQQIQLRTEDRENGDLGAVAP